VIKAVAADWNSMLCFTGSGDRTVCVWDIASGERKKVFTGFKGWVCQMCLDTEEQQLVAADMEGVLRLCYFGSEEAGPPRRYPAVETSHRDRGVGLQLSVDWSRKRALVFSEQARPSMYSLFSGQMVCTLMDTFFPLERTIGTCGVEVDWDDSLVLLTCSGRLALFSMTERASLDSPPLVGKHDGGAVAELCPRSEDEDEGEACFGPFNVECFRANWHKTLVVTFLLEPLRLELWSLETREIVTEVASPDNSLGRMLSFDVEWESDIGIRVTTTHGMLEPVVFLNWALGHDRNQVTELTAQLCFEHDTGRGGSSPIAMLTGCAAKP
jgi:WD40 repeat protein